MWEFGTLEDVRVYEAKWEPPKVQNKLAAQVTLDLAGHGKLKQVRKAKEAFTLPG